MFKLSCACLAFFGALLVSCSSYAQSSDDISIPLPPAINELFGLPKTYTKGRSAYLEILTRHAEQTGLPPAIADAVIRVESSFNPHAVGGVGEVGLMQVRPETAAMLGFSGGVTDLFEPETNILYGVRYLARAWQLAQGDVCRALMKYRAGWGNETMTPLSVEYCRRAKGHLAAIGSPLAGGAVPSPDAPGANAPTFSADAKTFRGQPAPGPWLPLPPGSHQSCSRDVPGPAYAQNRGCRFRPPRTSPAGPSGNRCCQRDAANQASGNSSCRSGRCEDFTSPGRGRNQATRACEDKEEDVGRSRCPDERHSGKGQILSTQDHALTWR